MEGFSFFLSLVRVVDRALIVSFSLFMEWALDASRGTRMFLPLRA
jgi:hypothetical protein